MRKIVLSLILMLTFLVSCHNQTINHVEEIRNAISCANRATVAIIQDRTESSDEAARPYCSGFFISRTMIVSALHCFQDVRTVRIGNAIYRVFLVPNPTGHVVQFVRYGEINMLTLNFTNNTVNEARVIYSDLENDVALLSIEPGTEPSNVYLSLRQDAPSITEHVYLFGHPDGIVWTVVDGIISRIINDEHGIPIAIQSSAPLVGGFSGGPLINERGEVVGVARGYISNMHHISIFTSSNQVLNLAPIAN